MLGKVEREIVSDISDAETLCDARPDMTERLQAGQDLKQIIAADGSNIGRFSKTTGFVPGSRTMQRVGWIPLELFVAIEEISPGFFRDPKKKYWFLKNNPQFDLRTKV